MRILGVFLPVLPCFEKMLVCLYFLHGGAQISAKKCITFAAFNAGRILGRMRPREPRLNHSLFNSVISLQNNTAALPQGGGAAGV